MIRSSYGTGSRAGNGSARLGSIGGVPTDQHGAWASDTFSQILASYQSQIDALREAGYGDLVDSAIAQWRGTLASYQPGILDNIGGFFGARTGQSKYIEYVSAQLGEALNGIAQQRQLNEYNTPLQQSARERQAGINSDLLGIGDVAGAAAPAEDTNNVLPETQALTLGNLGDIGQGVLSAVSSAFGFMQSIGNLRHTNLINKGIKIQNADGMLNAVRSAIGKVIPHIKDLPDGKYDRESMSQQVIESLSMMYNPYQTGADGRRRRNRASQFNKAEWEQFRDMASNLLMSAPVEEEAFNDWTRQLKAGSEMVATETSMFNSFNINDLYDVMKLIVPYQDQAKKLIAESEQYRAQYDKDYAEFMKDFGGDLMAQYDATKAGSESSQSVYDENIKRLQELRSQAENAVLDFIQKKASSGDQFWQWVYIGYSLNLDMNNIIGNTYDTIGGLGSLLNLLL